MFNLICGLLALLFYGCVLYGAAELAVYYHAGAFVMSGLSAAWILTSLINEG